MRSNLAKAVGPVAATLALCGVTASMAADSPDAPNLAQQVADLKASNDQLRTLIPS